MTPEKRQQQTKGASARCHLTTAARCTLNPIVRNARNKAGKPQFEQKMQWSKQNLISLPLVFMFDPALMPGSGVGCEGAGRKPDLNKTGSPPKGINFCVPQG